MISLPMILTVSQLNQQIKNYLEQDIGIVQVEGEISNLSRPSSGHLYFTLKDSNAQIRCAFFKNRNYLIANELKDGQQVIAKGRLSLYTARGDYQLIVDDLNEAGLGKLFQEFEALKQKLKAEGLFDVQRKKTIPKIPKIIGVITSPSGAALQDILTTLQRRFPLVNVLIYPSEVQGAQASEQLIKALEHAYAHDHCDVLILARGGGSLEDLWAFNHELLARIIAKSPIPIVSGIGHETDFTIADFVADLRAATPTAAATAVTPHLDELHQLITSLSERLSLAMQRSVQDLILKLSYLSTKLASPKQLIKTHWQNIDHLERQLISEIRQIIKHKNNYLETLSQSLANKNPINIIEHNKLRLKQINSQLQRSIFDKINLLRYQLKTNLSTLNAVSPLATLDRGYSLTTKNGRILFDKKGLKIGEFVDIRLAKALLKCEIKEMKGIK